MAPSPASSLSLVNSFIAFLGTRARKGLSALPLSAGAFFLDARRARTADAQFQVGSGQRNAIVRGLQEHIRQDWNGGLFFHHTLRETQLTYQIALADGEFHFPLLLVLCCLYR